MNMIARKKYDVVNNAFGKYAVGRFLQIAVRVSTRIYSSLCSLRACLHHRSTADCGFVCSLHSRHLLNPSTSSTVKTFHSAFSHVSLGSSITSLAVFFLCSFYVFSDYPCKIALFTHSLWSLMHEVETIVPTTSGVPLNHVIVLHWGLQNCRGSRLILSRIWGSHGGEYEDGCLLGCSAV
jgi:hypothetical protein